MVRMAKTFVDVNDTKARDACGYLALSTWVFSRTFMNALSGPEDDGPYKEELRSAYPCSSSFVPSILSAPDRSMAALIELSMALDAIPIDEKRRVEIDKSLVIVGDSVGAVRAHLFVSSAARLHSSHGSISVSAHGSCRSISTILLPVCTTLKRSC